MKHIFSVLAIFLIAVALSMSQSATAQTPDEVKIEKKATDYTPDTYQFSETKTITALSETRIQAEVSYDQGLMQIKHDILYITLDINHPEKVQKIPISAKFYNDSGFTVYCTNEKDRWYHFEPGIIRCIHRPSSGPVVVEERRSKTKG